jgi:hypothetical protein
LKWLIRDIGTSPFTGQDAAEINVAPMSSNGSQWHTGEK